MGTKNALAGEPATIGNMLRQVEHRRDRFADTREEADIVLMDLRMPGMGGIEATRILSETRPDSAVVVAPFLLDLRPPLSASKRISGSPSAVSRS